MNQSGGGDDGHENASRSPPPGTPGAGATAGGAMAGGATAGEAMGGRATALAGLRVLDLSRVLAGPWATQILGDLGAEVYKVEQPGHGDDTRRWGPPFLADGSGDSAYFLCTNRNKHALAIDFAKPEGAALIRQMAGQCDVVVENFRAGALAKYGLDAATLRAADPRLIYCSITGFGQDGPYRDRSGYDFLIQGMSGLMSVTGLPDELPGGGPMKVGVPITDLVTGLYAAVAILAALHHRERTGSGQHIDLALLDAAIASLSHQASAYLNGGVVPRRLGNEHPNLVPYQDFTCADGSILVALGNDRQFRTFCALLGRPDLAEDPRFADSAGRSRERMALAAALRPAIAGWNSAALLGAMQQAGLPAGKVATIPESLADPHVAAHGLLRQMARPDGTPTTVLGFPGRLAETPARYDRAPPRLGADTAAVLRALLGLDAERIAALQAAEVIADPEIAGRAG